MKNQNKIRICAVVTGKTLKEFIDNMERIQQQTDLVELRIDYIRDVKKIDLNMIKKSLTKSAILTCRRKSDYGKGKFEGTYEQQNEIIQYANDLGFDYIDIEWREYDKIQINNKKTKIILSYHDWEKTDNIITLKKLLQQMRQKQEYAIKIAAMIKSDEDIKNITKLLLLKEKHENLIVIGMGERAAFMRSFAPLLGSYLTFSAVDQSYSAPGQLNIKTMEEIYTLLGYNL